VGVSNRLDQDVRVCYHCGSSNINIDVERGEAICRNCGTVVQEHIVDMGPEWRAYTQEEANTNARAHLIKLTLPGHGLGNSVIGTSLGGTSLQQRLRLIARFGRSLNQHTERKIGELLEILKPLRYRLSLPDNVVDNAIFLYRRLNKDDVRGIRTRDLAIALLFYSCRNMGIVCTLKDIKAAANVERSRGVSRALSIIRRALGNSSTIQRSQEELGRFLQRIMSKLRLNDDVRFQVTKLSMDIITAGKRCGLTNGRTFYALVASAVYIAVTLLNVKKRQREIAEAAGVTDVTIRNRYKEILDKVDITITV